MIRSLAIAALLAWPAAAQDGGAEDMAARADAAARRLAVAGELLGAAEGASDRIAALTEAVRAYEDGLAALRDGLRRVAVRSQALEAELGARSGEIQALLAALQSMGRTPAPVLLLHPSGPVGTARAGIIAAEIVPAVEARAAELRAELQELAELRALQESAAETLREGLSAMQAARAELGAALSDRTDLPRRFTEDGVATALLLASTDTLDAFAGSLARIVAEETDVAAPDATARKGRLALPVRGEVLRRAGEPDAAGIERPGIVVATPPQAVVIAPAAATIRFRGTLLDYGEVVILEPAPDVLFVLAGLGTIYGETGQVLPEGAPVGLMGGAASAAHAILTDIRTGTGAERSETLYLEVREGQAPVDPASWFALED